MKDMIITKSWLIKAKESELKANSNGYNPEFAELSTIDGDKSALGILGKITRETEKAVALETEIWDVMGNDRTWTVWFPKSQIIKIVQTELA